MNIREYQIGELVTVKVRTGNYIGEVYELYDMRLVVKILAVVKHPEQGDLHHPNDPDVPMFHERRALAYTEKTTVLPRDVQPYSGDIPDYKQSLAQAAQQELYRLDKLYRWAAKSKATLEDVIKTY
jgi:kinase-associated protein B